MLKRGRQLEEALVEVRDWLLCPEIIGKGARIPLGEGEEGDEIMVLSASDLAFWATERGWLDVSDLAGGQEEDEDEGETSQL